MKGKNKPSELLKMAKLSISEMLKPHSALTAFREEQDRFSVSEMLKPHSALTAFREEQDKLSVSISEMLKPHSALTAFREEQDRFSVSISEMLKPHSALTAFFEEQDKLSTSLKSFSCQLVTPLKPTPQRSPSPQPIDRLMIETEKEFKSDSSSIHDPEFMKFAIIWICRKAKKLQVHLNENQAPAILFESLGLCEVTLSLTEPPQDKDTKAMDRVRAGGKKGGKSGSYKEKNAFIVKYTRARSLAEPRTSTITKVKNDLSSKFAMTTLVQWCADADKKDNFRRKSGRPKKLHN